MKHATRLFLGLFTTLVLPLPHTLAFHKPGHIPPSGTCREAKCPCSKEDEEKIKGLIGRLRALKEVADMTRREYNRAVATRDDAWRSFAHPFSGSGARYVNSVLGMLSISTGAGSNWIGWANAGIGMGQSINQGSVEWDTWLNTGTQVVGDDAFMNAAMKELIQEAARKAGDAYIDQASLGIAVQSYGKHMKIPDTPITVGQAQSAVKVVSAANNVYGCVKATDDLVNDLSNYYEQRREAKQLKKQLNQIDDQIEAILKELEELRKRCASNENAGEASQGSFGTEKGSTKGLTDTSTDSVSSDDAGPDEAVLQKLFVFRAQLDKVEARFRNRLFVPLSPFMIRAVRSNMAPQLLFAISREALPDLKVWPKEIEEAVALAREIERDLKL